jgi:hypothetical protein
VRLLQTAYTAYIPDLQHVRFDHKISLSTFFLKPCRQALPPLTYSLQSPFHSTFNTHPPILLFKLHAFRHSPPVMQSTAANDVAVPVSLVISVPQHHTTTSSGPTLRVPSPPVPSSSSHSGLASSHLSLHNSATRSDSSLGSDASVAKRQEIQDAWIDAEGEIPASRLWQRHGTLD